MQSKETKWTPIKALGRAQKKLNDLDLPKFQKPESPGDLEFPTLSTCDNKQLEEFLTMIGAYKAYLEIEVADVEATIGAYEAAFNEGYNTAVYKVVNEYEEAGKKKPTRDELRGEILSKYGSLKELKYDLIEQQASFDEFMGLLKAYTTAFTTISRVITIRTYGQQL